MARKQLGLCRPCHKVLGRLVGKRSGPIAKASGAVRRKVKREVGRKGRAQRQGARQTGCREWAHAVAARRRLPLPFDTVLREVRAGCQPACKSVSVNERRSTVATVG